MDEKTQIELARMTTENFRLELRVAELEAAEKEKTADRLADAMAAEEEDAEGMEGHRQIAWASLPLRDIRHYWEDDEGDFVFPDGWPPSVDKAEYFREYLGDSIPQAGPAADETEDTAMDRKYRELVGESGD